MGTDMRTKLIIALFLLFTIPSWGIAGSQQIRNVVTMAKTQGGGSEFCDGTDVFCTSWETGTDALNTGATGNEDVWDSSTGTTSRIIYAYEGTYGLSTGAVNSYVEKNFGSDLTAATQDMYFEIDTESMATGNNAILSALRNSGGTNLVVVYIVEDANPDDSTVLFRVSCWLASSLVQVGSDQNISLDTRYRVTTSYDTVANTFSWVLKDESGSEITSGSGSLTANNLLRIARVGDQLHTMTPKVGAWKLK